MVGYIKTVSYITGVAGVDWSCAVLVMAVASIGSDGTFIPTVRTHSSLSAGRKSSPGTKREQNQNTQSAPIIQILGKSHAPFAGPARGEVRRARGDVWTQLKALEDQRRVERIVLRLSNTNLVERERTYNESTAPTTEAPRARKDSTARMTRQNHYAEFPKTLQNSSGGANEGPRTRFMDC
ncbi:hypothetical protein DFH09DRAFT_1087547 [Mycena vulgaris]|nr:hypothetical protein DFH09DRAFT_1087547 [Mycena vulgaris]